MQTPDPHQGAAIPGRIMQQTPWWALAESTENHLGTRVSAQKKSFNENYE